MIRLPTLLLSVAILLLTTAVSAILLAAAWVLVTYALAGPLRLPSITG